MFTRGGVYRVVKEALGGTFAKLSVSALMFDYILTGPISGVSAGQYITGLMNELLVVAANSHWLPPALMDAHNHPFQFNMNSTAAVFAAAVTIYYWWQNIKGIEEREGSARHTNYHCDGGGSVFMGRLFGIHSWRTSSPASYSVEPEVQRRCAGLPQEFRSAYLRPFRHPDGLWSLYSGHER
jgi:hypothetical protein